MTFNIIYCGQGLETSTSSHPRAAHSWWEDKTSLDTWVSMFCFPLRGNQATREGRMLTWHPTLGQPPETLPFLPPPEWWDTNCHVLRTNCVFASRGMKTLAEEKGALSVPTHLVIITDYSYWIPKVVKVWNLCRTLLYNKHHLITLLVSSTEILKESIVFNVLSKIQKVAQ